MRHDRGDHLRAGCQRPNDPKLGTKVMIRALSPQRANSARLLGLLSRSLETRAERCYDERGRSDGRKLSRASPDQRA